MTIISNGQFSLEVVTTGGELTNIFLIILLSISLLVADTKYWNGYISHMLSTFYKPLLLVFVAIVIFKIILIIL